MVALLLSIFPPDLNIPVGRVKYSEGTGNRQGGARHAQGHRYVEVTGSGAYMLKPRLLR